MFKINKSFIPKKSLFKNSLYSIQSANAGSKARIEETGPYLENKITTRGDSIQLLGGAGETKNIKPFELLISSLGLCTSVTVRMYAQTKNIALDKIVVDTTYEKVDGKDVLNVEIGLIGDKLTPEDRKKLMIVAKGCPVHRLIHSEETSINIKEIK